MKKWLVILAACFPILIYAQKPNSTLEGESINIPYLEQLVFDEVNEYRIKRKMEALLPDSLMLQASENHAQYLSYHQRLTHFQPKNKSLKDPQLRIEYFGVHDVNAGENVLSFPFNSPVKQKNGKIIEPKTYQEYADVLAEVWWTSKAHKANILTSEFKISALSIVLDDKDQMLYAVQVFGDPIVEYEYTFSPSTFPYAEISDEKKKLSFEFQPIKEVNKYAYGLKVPQSFGECPPSVKKKWNSLEGSITVTRDKMLLCVYDLNDLNGLFVSKKDGLAMELINFSNQFQCGEEYTPKANTRNGMSLLDGELQKPLFRNEIEQQIEELKERNRKQKNKSKEKSCNYIKLGDTPEGFTRYPYEARLHYIRGKKLCTQVEFNSYCGELLTYKPSNLPLQYQPLKEDFKPRSERTTVQVEVGFDRNSTEFRRAELEEIIQQLKNQEYQVNSIRIDAFASIEGSSKNNKKIFRKRAEVLVAELEQYQSEKIQYKLNAKENWELFYQQIDSTDFYQMRVWPKERVKDWLKDSVNLNKLEPLLAQQRNAKITLVITPIQNTKWKGYMAHSEWKDLLVKPSKTESDWHQMEVIQAYLQRQFLSDQPDKVDYQLEYPKGADYYGFAYRQLIFGLRQGNEYNAVSVVETLKRYNKELESREVDYNIKALIANHADDFSEKEKILLIRSLLSELKSQQAEPALIADVEMWFHIEMANLIYKGHKKNFIQQAEPSLDYIKNNYLKNDSSLNRKLELASYFIAYEQSDWAKELLEEEVQSDSVEARVLKMYVLHCMNYEIEHFPARFYTQLKRLHAILPEKEWCSLFMGPCRIGFEVLDWPSTRSLYCESCSSLISSSADQSNK